MEIRPHVHFSESTISCPVCKKYLEIHVTEILTKLNDRIENDEIVD